MDRKTSDNYALRVLSALPGGLEASIRMLAGMPGYVAGGLAGAAVAPFAGAEAARDVQEGVSSRLSPDTYLHPSKGAEDVAQMLNSLNETAGEAGARGARAIAPRKWENEAELLGQTLAQFGLQMLPVPGVPGAARIVKRAMELPSGPVVGSPSAQLGMLAGPKGAVSLGGQTLKKFKTGEAVAETGVPSQELWRSYGYAKGAEGKGRFEISDVPAKLKEGARKAKTVGEALEHPELFEAYPDLQKIPLELRISSLMSSGHYNPEAEIIKAWGLGDQEAKSVLLHELQHAVQRREGFAPGANLRGGKEAYERSAGEQEAYNVQRRLADPDLMRFTPEMTESLPREMQIIKQDPRAVMEAVKEPGGMWHPEAVERLAEPLRQKLGSPEEYAPYIADRPEYGGTGKIPEPKAEAWATRAIRNYLNKYAGTERDPLKDVEVPFGEGTKRWEELWDKSIAQIPAERFIEPGGRQEAGKMLELAGASKLRPGEIVHDILSKGHPTGGAGMAGMPPVPAITDYLSHVGDYLRQNVSPEKLQQYDLVRAVRETAANDARVAKEMEKAAQASMKDLPVYKDYSTQNPGTLPGMKWVELKKPEKLTEEQARGVRKATKDQLENIEVEDPFGMPGERNAGALYEGEGYVAVDAAGKPVKNSYTGNLAGGRTPEEAHLAGQLAQEGNQMGHCVGGYCEGVASGESRIFSLRDAKGRSHVTVEVAPVNEGRNAEHLVSQFLKEFPEEARKYDDPALKDSTRHFLRRTLSEVINSKAFFEWRKTYPEDILQIKGKQNRAPNAEYLPYVQDFVKSGKWGEVGDLGNTGLVATSSVHADDLRVWKDGMGRRMQPAEREAALAELKKMPSYITRKEFDDFLRKHSQQLPDEGLR